MPKCLTVQLVHIYNGKKPDDRKVKMKNKTRRGFAAFLLQQLIATAVPEALGWVYTKTGGYTESPKVKMFGGKETNPG